MFGKRGISPLIATVMLIGFSIAMAAIVSTFVINQTKTTFNPENLLEDSSLCDQMVLGAVVPNAEKLKIVAAADRMETTPAQPARLQGVLIQNKGAYALRGLVIQNTKEETVEIPYYFDTRVSPNKKIADRSLIDDQGLDVQGTNQYYVAPAKIYKFGDKTGDSANDATPGSGIPLKKYTESSTEKYYTTIKVYPIIWDFEKEKAVKCIKSVLMLDISEVCKSYGKNADTTAGTLCANI